MLLIGLLLSSSRIALAKNCESGWIFENDVCKDINECKQQGKEIDVSENICGVTTWTTYAKAQEVSAFFLGNS